LDVSEKTARRYVKSGALPSVFVGGAYRVSEETLEEFLQGAKVTPGGDSPKVGRVSSPAPSFDDELAAERRKRERLLVGLISMFVEDGEKFEDLLKTCEGIPLIEADEYGRHSQALWLSYEEMASNGPVSAAVREAKGRLDALDGRVNGLLGQLMEPGDLAQLQSRDRFAKKRRAELMHGDEANTTSEADVS
jgi:excisionase family DNA binding protein